MSKSKYMTRQRKALLSWLQAHPDELFPAQEIADALGEESLSLSAVYRNLAELEEEGKVRRSLRGGGREVSFQYLDAAACRDCLHLSCTRCGRTFHMDAEGARTVLDTVAARDGFAVDKAETVLYGLCGACRSGGHGDGDADGGNHPDSHGGNCESHTDSTDSGTGHPH